MAYLLQTLDRDGRATVRLYGQSTLRIGRGTNNAVRLDDPGVELEHAVIVQDAEGYLLQDLSRSGGTWVNERRLSGDHRLADGDRVVLATFRIAVDAVDPRSPLVLTISRLEQPPESSASAVRSLRELMARQTDEPAASFSEATIPTLLSRDLVAMAEAERARELTGAAAALPLDRTAAGVARPAAGPAAGEPGPPPVDYAGSYRLQHGFLRAGVLAAALSLAAAGGISSLVRNQRWQAFSPGDLADVHRRIDGRCQECHAGWRPVADRACRECHRGAGDHQTTQLAKPACVDCHREHRGGDALRLAAEGACVDCHGRLGRQIAGSRFVVRITDFAPGDHPEFRLPVERDGAGERVALDDPAAGTSDPGGIKGFDHDWHLNRLPAHVRELDCEDCHHRGDDGEIVPIVFETSCQECHNLVFDPRFEGEPAPHGAPGDVLTRLVGRYALNPELLRDLRGEERRRLSGRRLSEEQKLRELALLATERLLRNRCRTCHELTPALASRTSRNESLRRDQIEALAVLPAAIRERWLPHAEFEHGVHLELGMDCRQCHPAAAASRTQRDVLLPGIDVCFECHRTGGDVPENRRGRTTCVSCHGYHPGADEGTAPAPALSAAGETKTAG